MPAFTVHHVRRLSPSAFVVRFDRHELSFQPGQYVTVGLGGSHEMREYSVYSSLNDPYLEILVKEVDSGILSPRLGRLRPGDRLHVDGPFGFFTFDEDWKDQSYLFVATGTGISPFHCFARSYPGVNYRLLHGVRSGEEMYDMDRYDSDRVVRCTSRDRSGSYRGRVTDYLRTHGPGDATRFYLCGNCNMIYQVFDILQELGAPHEQIFAEVYF